MAPIHVSIMKVAKSAHIVDFIVGENFDDLIFFFLFIGMDIIRIDAISAITPPSFDGIDRRIAYANRKYHSG